MLRHSLAILALSLTIVVVAGCGPAAKAPPEQAKKEQPAKDAQADTDEVAAERAKLSPEDRALVDAQEWCAITNDERLGSMGAPIKIMIKDQPVFLCCKGCTRSATANPEKTLAKVEELKAKAKKGG